MAEKSAQSSDYVLKPCPFCGSRAIMVKGCAARHFGRFSVTCGGCFCATPWELEKENAVFDWNRRK